MHRAASDCSRVERRVGIEWLIDSNRPSVLTHEGSACGQFATVHAQNAGNVAMSAIELKMVTRVSNCECHVIATPDTRPHARRLKCRSATGRTKQNDGRG